MKLHNIKFFQTFKASRKNIYQDEIFPNMEELSKYRLDMGKLRILEKFIDIVTKTNTNYKDNSEYINGLPMTEKVKGILLKILKEMMDFHKLVFWFEDTAIKSTLTKEFDKLRIRDQYVFSYCNTYTGSSPYYSKVCNNYIELLHQYEKILRVERRSRGKIVDLKFYSIRQFDKVKKIPIIKYLDGKKMIREKKETFSENIARKMGFSYSEISRMIKI